MLRLDKMGTKRCLRNIMGGCTGDVFVATLHLQQMTVGDAGVKTKQVVSDLFIQETDQLFRLFTADMTCRVVDQQITVDAHQVAPHRHLSGQDLHAHAGSLEHTTPFIDSRNVVAQHREIGDLTPRSEAIGYRVEHSISSFPCQLVHIWSMGRLQWSSVSQCGNAFMGHAVAQYNDSFHTIKNFFFFDMYGTRCNHVPVKSIVDYVNYFVLQARFIRLSYVCVLQFVKRRNLYYLIFAIEMMSAKTPAAVTLAPAP